MTRPKWKETPLTFYHAGKPVQYEPFVVKAGPETHLLALHKDGNWKLSNPNNGQLIVEVYSYTLGQHQRPRPSGYLNAAKAREFARRAITQHIRAIGANNFNEAMRGQLIA